MRYRPGARGGAGARGRPGTRGGTGRVPAIAPFVALVLGACLADRERPDPFEPIGSPVLSAAILAPATGATVRTGQDITLRVEARDLGSLRLQGVGFVARSAMSGVQLVDSAVVRFASRSDTTHEFTFQVPNSFVTNTQVDVNAIAFGPGSAAALSEPVHLVVVQCPDGTCQ